MNTLVADLLRTRLRVAAADPLVTYYDVGKGQRIELSAATFANWVAKTANLLAWEVSVAPGDPVALPLAAAAPGHWMTAVWEVALWQVGAYVDLSTDGQQQADVVVCGPDWPTYAGASAEVLACSLHPFATGLGAGLPASVTDVDLAIRAQPDSYAPTPVAPTALGWIDAERRLTQADLAAVAGSDRRRLVVPTDAWTTARDGILAALTGGGSTVVVVGGSDQGRARISDQEGAT